MDMIDECQSNLCMPFTLVVWHLTTWLNTFDGIHG
jgi:hypothetical protein